MLQYTLYREGGPLRLHFPPGKRKGRKKQAETGLPVFFQTQILAKCEFRLVTFFRSGINSEIYWGYY